jgi:hypothetical protein
VAELSERSLSGLEGLASNLQVGLWLPLGFPSTTKENYRVITMTFPKTILKELKHTVQKGDITTQQHLDIFNDFIDLEEVDHEYAKMRLFAQIFFWRSQEMV